MRGRFKGRSFKADGVTLGMDMCPYCYSFGCDPMAMSPAFSQKIEERRRKGLCPCCGEPASFCKCKSSSQVAPGTHVLRTHNNKKRNAAKQQVQCREAAYLAWAKNEDLLSGILGDNVYAEVYTALRNHQVPAAISWNQLQRKLFGSTLDQQLFAAGWDEVNYSGTSARASGFCSP